MMTEIKKLMVAAATKDVSGFAETFKALMGARILEAIEQRQDEISASEFADEDDDDNADEDEIIDIDEETDDNDDEDDDDLEAIADEIDQLDDDEYAAVAESLILAGHLSEEWVDDPDPVEMCRAIKSAKDDRTKKFLPKDND